MNLLMRALLDDPVDPTNTVAAIRLSAAAVAALIGAVIPLLTALVTNLRDRLKGIVTLVLNAVSTLIVTNIVDNEAGIAVFTPPILLTWVIATAASVVAYLNVWKPLELTSSLVDRIEDDGRIAKVPGKLADVGLRK